MVAALVAAGALFWPERERNHREAPPSASPSAGLVLAGVLQASRVDPLRFEVRCTSLRWEDVPTIHCAALDAQGRFVLTGLADVDYRVEVVARANPALVLARVEFVRPGCDELVVVADASLIFGAEANTDRATQ